MAYISVKKANCKNCYKCLKFCDVKSIRYIDDRVEVIEDQCVLCGHCINVCPQKAKTVVNDPSRILSWLQDPEVRTVASLAPSYAGIYGGKRDQLVAALYKLGFDRVEETAVGAREVTLRYRELMEQGDMPCILTTCCPTVNTLITKYYPRLVPMMAPVVSPVLAHGRMIKARDGADTRVVFVGPCLSKIKEIDEHPESADGVLSFRNLEKLLEQRGISLDAPAEQGAGEKDMEPVYSRIYPIPEGILRDMRYPETAREDNGYQMMSVCGLQNVMTFLQELSDGDWTSPDKGERLFVELNSCEGGCVNGPLIPEERRAVYRGRLEVDRYASASAEKRPAPPRLQELECRFTPDAPRKDMPDEATIRRILTEIGKPTPDKELNCGSCGYSTCRDKAIAVYQGKAELYMCLPYINDLSQSLSSVTLSVTPNMVIAVDKELRIIELNLAAQKTFGVSRQQALKAGLFEYMDPADFEEVFATHRNIVDKKVKLESLSMIARQTLLYVESQDIVMGFLQDITEEEQRKEQTYRARLESAEMAQKVIEKQMIAAQEIASLLGETTAETKVTLNNLKAMIMSEETQT